MTKLRPQDWKSGDKLWIVEVIAPFGGAEGMVKDLKDKVFPEREIHFLNREQGRQAGEVRVMQWLLRVKMGERSGNFINPRFVFRSSKGTEIQASRSSDSWKFIYTNADLVFEFSCSKIAGTLPRDVGPGLGTAHQLGPECSLHVWPNEQLNAMAEARKKLVLGEIADFLVQFSTQPPKDAHSVPFEVEDNEEFRLQMEGRWDRGLSGIFGDIVPIAKIILAKGIFGEGVISVGGPSESI